MPFDFPAPVTAPALSPASVNATRWLAVGSNVGFFFYGLLYPSLPNRNAACTSRACIR